MLWFALFGFLGYLTYRIYRHYWFRGLQRKVMQYHNVKYQKLSGYEKKNLRQLVDAVLNSGMTLDDDTNQIVDMVFRESQMADLYDQDDMGMGLREIRDSHHGVH